MSIIYGTLARLEAENPVPPGREDIAIVPHPEAVDPRGFPVKTVAALVMVLVTGMSAWLWPPGDETAGARQPAPAVALDRPVAVVKPFDQLQPVTVQARPVAPLQVTAPQSPAPAGERADIPAATPAGMTAATVQQLANTKAPETGIDAVEEPLAVAAVKAAPATPPAATHLTVVEEPVEPGNASTGVTIQSDGADEAIEQARLALSRGRYQQALSALEALEYPPENRADFWLIQGSAFLGTGRLDSAETAFTAAQALAPDDAKIAVQLAILKQEKGDHAGALQILEQAATHHPAMPEIFLNQGYSQEALGAVREARRSFRAFLEVTADRSLYRQQRRVVREWLARASSMQGED